MRQPIVVQGRELDDQDIGWLRDWVGRHAHWSRRKLAGELCALWNWRDASGRPKDLAARSFLLKCEQRGWITLPPLREAYRKPRADIRLPQRIPPGESLEAGFAKVGPIRLDVMAAGTEAHRRWAYYLSRHHYLGLRVVGQNIGYLATDRSGNEVAALLFGAPAWRCAARDSYLRQRGIRVGESLERIANNTRFLIFPWVRVPHLASHLLGAAARRVSRDWREKYGHGLEWLETFVERGRFAGTCYKAANWVCVGATRGRGRQDRGHSAAVPVKDVWLYPLGS